MPTTRTFTRQQLYDMGLPERRPKGGKKISDTIIDQGRWSTDHELIVQFPEQVGTDEAWRFYYSHGSTECQDECPWEHDTRLPQLWSDARPKWSRCGSRSRDADAGPRRGGRWRVRPKLPVRWVASPAFDAGCLDWDAIDGEGKLVARINDDALLGYGVRVADGDHSEVAKFWSLEDIRAHLRRVWDLPKPARFTREERGAV